MSSSKRIVSFIIFIVLLAGLCGCDTEFDEAREKIEENRFFRQESKLLTSDFEVQNVEIDYSQSSSYSNYLHIVGIIKNKSNKKASSITLTLYLYQNDSLVLTEKEYVFDLGAYDENSFDFLIDRVKLLTCDEYIVRVTDVF